jgi:hypothetical protein
MINRSESARGIAMKTTTTMKWMAIGALAIFAAGVSSANAQSTLGGAKPQQNKLGGVAKPAPVIGGATIKTPPPAPPKPVIGTIKPASPGTIAPGTITPGATSNAAALGQAPPPRPNPVVAPINKSTTVVTSNLKCGSGACTSKGTKP